MEKHSGAVSDRQSGKENLREAQSPTALMRYSIQYLEGSPVPGLELQGCRQV